MSKTETKAYGIYNDNLPCIYVVELTDEQRKTVNKALAKLGPNSGVNYIGTRSERTTFAALMRVIGEHC